jgi:hypothetical protein
MAKLKKFPKMPKAGANLKTIQAKEKAFQAVKKHNDAVKREDAQRKSARERLAKMKQK